jgi:hypothetical protein
MRNTLSDGLVSGLRGLGNADGLIQTTAAISRGSSGGPLLSESGEVVGITTLSVVDGQNLNLAVPASRLSAILQRKQELRTLGELAAKARQPVVEWTINEKRNLAYFFAALKGERETTKRFLEERVVTAQAQIAYCYLLQVFSLYDARLVNVEVLRKVHPELPGAFKGKFLRFLETAESATLSRRRLPADFPRSINAWTEWWEANKKEFQFPASIPVPRELNLTYEWSREWKGVRFPRFVPE